MEKRRQHGDGEGTVQYFNPRNLDRLLLKDPKDLRMQLPNRPRPFAPAGDFAKYLVTMCQHAGLSVSVEDFLFYRHSRWIHGKSHGLRRARAKVTSGQLFVMYTELRRGETPALFLAILRTRGYVPWTDRPLVVRVQGATQLGLDLEVAAKPVIS